MNFTWHSIKMCMTETPQRPNELSPNLPQAINKVMERVMTIKAEERWT